MRRALVTFLVAAALFGVIPSSVAHDHRPPQVSLETTTATQDGKRIYAYWPRQKDGRCKVTGHFDFTTFPRTIPYATGTTAGITLFKPEAPVNFVMRAWRRVGEDGRPYQAPEVVPMLLEPVREGAETVAWRLEFLPDLVEGDLYLQLEVYWRDEEGCGPAADAGAQQASWTFHLEAE